MPANKNALLRYKTIDRCLCNRSRRWTLEDLINACSDALYEYTGKDEYVSRRTVQSDIQRMRSGELGYNAPIVVYDNKYYKYSDPDYSITDTPISENDLQQLGEAVSILKQLSGFTEFCGMEDIVGRLEDHLNAVRHVHPAVISLESNGRLKGLKHLTTFYEAIARKQCVRLGYRPFRHCTPDQFTFSPYLLKEWHNRWFVFGKVNGKPGISNIALDRISSVESCPGAVFEPDGQFNPDTWFKDIIGVSRGKGAKVEVRFLATASEAPYIMTKPIHPSQKVVKRNDDMSIEFSIEVIPNHELEQALLEFGEGIKVLAPKSLVHTIKYRLRKAACQYR